MADTMVFYHAKCSDGFGAAFAAWLTLKDAAEYVPCSYGDAPPDVTGKRVFILDFSFERSVMVTLESQAAELILLDHHKTAKENLSGFTCRCGKVTFDLSRSGARMAWEHFHPGVTPPRMIEHIQDRDLWTWKLHGTREYLAALDHEGYDFEKWLHVLNMTDTEQLQFMERGRAMNDQFQTLSEEIADAQSAIPVVLQGHQGLMVNASPQFTSEVGNLLALRSGTFGLVWRLDKPDAIKVGLRSVAPFDVEKIARTFGGGGHPQASAFRIPVSKLPDLIAGKL
jgi:oligoribonuclease NrnB/cAMP/cGMP phosphodiesterase (DHH superfamily)